MSDVSRETRRLCEHYGAVAGLASYAGILAEAGVRRGLIGPREVERIWPRHIANCAVVAEEARDPVPPGSRVVDVGSGAGLPGIVWALVRPDLAVTLVEPLLRRVTFLTEVVDTLGLGDRVSVQRARAEDLPEAGFDVATARAVAPLPQLVRWALPLVRPGGWLVALKGAGADQELAQARTEIAALGGGSGLVARFGRDLLAEPTTAVLIPRQSGRRSAAAPGRNRTRRKG